MDSCNPPNSFSEEKRFASTLPALPAAPIRKTRILRQISTEKDPPVSSIQDISDYVYIYKTKHHKELTLNKHHKAEEVRSQMEQFSHNAQHSLFERRCRTALTTLNGRLNNTQSDTFNFSEEMDIRLKTLDNECKDRIQRMEERQNRELQKHESTRPVSIEDTPANFRRRSPKLLEMFRQERRLYHQSHFEAAAELRARCLEMDQIEAEDAYKRSLENFENEKNNILLRHQRERETMETWVRTRHEELQKDRRVQTEALGKRTSLLGNEITDKRREMRASAPTAVIRTLFFDNTQKRGTLIPMNEKVKVAQMVMELPRRSQEILMEMKPV